MPTDTPTTPAQIPVLQKAATIVGLLVGAALLLPTLGNIFLGPSELRKLKDLDTDKERRLVTLEQTVKEHSRELNGINNKMERLENAVTNGNQRTESELRELSKEMAKVIATAGVIKDSVADAVSIANTAKANSDNAIVYAEGAKKEAEKLNHTTSK